MSTEPLIRGAALMRGWLFVDSYATTVEHIGELLIPLASGAINKADIQGDLHDLVQDKAGRRSTNEITVFKNGGGAHLDVMMAHAVNGALAGR